MKLNKSMNILIVGLGLLGGSYAMALKKKGFSVSGITRSQKTIDYALSHGLIDRGTVEIDPMLIGQADLIVFAVYPGVFVQWIEEHQRLFKSGAVITDVTGVKGSIVDRIQGMLREDVEFIAAHPMAGKEVSGVEFSDDAIFQDANYIVVPTKKNTESAIALCVDLGDVLGFRDISVLTVDQHDSMIAFLSQLTHCIAVSLMCSNDSPHLERYTGDSFRDLTRIARLNDEMWSELFLLNRDQLLRQMDAFRGTFDQLYSYLKTGNREAMREMMRTSTQRRERFNKNNLTPQRDHLEMQGENV